MPLKLRRVVPPPPGCPMSTCMTLLGGVWTPEVIWNLSEGPRRFSELRRAVPAISAKVLSARLKDLEERGVLSRTVLPTSPPSVEYALTELGKELIPAIRAIVEVGSKLRVRLAAEAAGRAPGPERAAASRARPAPSAAPAPSACRARPALPGA